MALNFPDPATQTPVNTFSPSSTPSASTNGITYLWDGQKWNAQTNGDAAFWQRVGTTLSPVTAGDDISTTGDLTTADATVDTLTSSGDVQVGSLNSGPLAGFRNQIINGDFRIWQRGTTFTFGGGGIFTADHWRTYGTGSNVAVRSQDVPADEGFTFSLLSNLPTQPIELQDAGFASQFSAGSTWTLSCWAKTTTPPKAILAFADTSTGVNQGTSFGGGEKTMTAIQTKGDWVKYSATFTCDQTPASTNRCLRAYTDTKGPMVLWTGFQLEPGPVATPFEHRFIGTELALCERYFELVSGGDGSPLVGDGNGGTTKQTVLPYRTQKRVPSTVTATNAAIKNDGAIVTATLAFGDTNGLGAFIYATSIAGGTWGSSTQIRFTSLSADAEL